MDYNKLKGHVPDWVIADLPKAIEMAELNTPLRLAHFLSQCSHESAGFKALEENLNYSAKALLAVFPKYFKTEAQAKSYERNPSKIANYVYANRMSNGNAESGDGYKFRGRGCIQLTGAANYLLFGNYIGVNLLENPDLVKTKYPLTSAAFFWKNRKINQEADNEDNVKGVTYKVNGGYKGLEDRQKHFDEFFSLLK